MFKIEIISREQLRLIDSIGNFGTDMHEIATYYTIMLGYASFFSFTINHFELLNE
ncbi:hypothetical protein K8I28_08570 [bacterium]|nr:hypothetical protein [bacterium]